MKRTIAVAALLLVLSVPQALATGEQAPPVVCEGLTICSPVAGPWVVVPGPQPPSRIGTAAWELGCPDGFVGGLDVRVADPWIEVRFPGRMGSPVNPGVTTRRTTVFNATSVGPPGRPSTFIPFVGCIPAEGGPRTPTGVGSASRLQQHGEGPIVRRVRVVEIRRPRVRAGLGCNRGERVVSSIASLGFYTALHPTQAQLAKVHLTRQLIDEHVWITATRRGLPSTVSVQVQIHALCAPRFNR